MAQESLERTVRWYDRIAPVYDLVCGPLYAKPRRYALERMELQEGERVLEIGCGTGLNLPGMAEAVGPSGRVAGWDASWNMLERAHRRIEALEIEQVVLHEGDFLEPPRAALKGILMKQLGTAHPDVILCSYLLAIAPSWRQIFTRAFELLRPGGYLITVDTQPFQGGWRWLNPLAVPIANWSGHGDLRRPTREWCTRLPLTDLRQFHGGGVYVTRTRKLGRKRWSDGPPISPIDL